MTPVDRYLADLDAALVARGAARRRFLRECRDHLADAAAERGPERAVRDFGPAAQIAAAFDGEVAARRGVRSTFASVAGVVLTGGSTLALIHASSPGVTAPTGWVVTFFVAAQVAGVAAGLALVQALVVRRSAMPRGEILLLSRRNGCALVSAAVTMLSAGAALPGRGSALLLLAGPAVVCVALISVWRTRSLARRLDGPAGLAVRPPLEDLSSLSRLPIPSLGPRRLLAATACVAAAAAFLRDHGEHAAAGQALVTAGIEAAAVVACFAVLGRPLGLWGRRTP